MPNSDLESGVGEDTGLLASQRAAAERSYSYQSNPAGNGSSRKPNELEIFQTLVGIRFLAPGGGPADGPPPPKPANPLADIFRPSQAGAERFRNRGLYERALSQDLKYRVLYTFSNYIITNLYILQITLAATFTALSAYQSDLRIILTVLGAVNTVVAGMLAWITGQGMPIRFRRARDRYREVVKAIESAERCFATIDYVDWPEGTRPVPVKERDRLDKLYDEARLDQEANYPEVHHDPTAGDGGTAKAQELQEEIDQWRQKNQKDKQELEALRKQLKHAKGGSPEGPTKDSNKDSSKQKLINDE